MTAIHIDLEPPTGITGFRFGMPAEEVKAAAAALGEVQVQDEGVAKEWSHMTVHVAHPQVEITFNLEDGKTLTSINIFRPRPGSDEVTVTWRGIDVFATPAEEVLDRLANDGHRIHDREFLFPLIPGLSLGFSRDPAGDDDFPMDEETGVADYFLSVLTAPATYYDAVPGGHRTYVALTGGSAASGASGFPPRTQASTTVPGPSFQLSHGGRVGSVAR